MASRGVESIWVTRAGVGSEVDIEEPASELTRVNTRGKNVGTTGLEVDMASLGLESIWVTRADVGSEVGIGEQASVVTRVKTRGKNLGTTIQSEAQAP